MVRNRENFTAQKRQMKARPGIGSLNTFSALALTVALAGCSSAVSSHESHPQATRGAFSGEVMHAMDQPQDEADGFSDSQCEAISADDVLPGALAQIPDSASSDNSVNWDITAVDHTTFDACADLSWLTLPAAKETDSGLHQLLLFHRAEFIGPATTFVTYSQPHVERISGSTISTTWCWGGLDANGEPANRAASTFAWDPTISGLVREGDLPPVKP